MPQPGTVVLLVTGIGLSAGIAYLIARPREQAPLSFAVERTRDEAADEELPTEDTPDPAPPRRQIAAPGSLDALLDEIERVLDPTAGEVSEIENLSAHLLAFDPAAIERLFSLVEQDNASTDSHTLDRRLMALGALGTMASERPEILVRLKSYATRPVTVTKRQELRELDLNDRLEAFEFVAAAEPAFAREFVKNVDDVRVRAQFADRYGAGLRMTGKPEELIRKEVEAVGMPGK